MNKIQLKPMNEEKIVPPMMEVKDGFGYMGVIMWDEKTEEMQCHICGELSSSLANHIRKHKIKASDYKKKYGLNMKTSLVSPSTSKKLSMYKTDKFNMKLLFGTVDKDEIHKEAVRRGRLSGKARAKKKIKHSVEFKNKFGACDEQLKERFVHHCEKLGDAPSWNWLAKNDSGLLSSLQNRYKNYSNALKEYGYNTKKHVNMSEYGTEEVVRRIEEFVIKEKRLPNNKDTKRNKDLPDYMTISKYFGSWLDAKKYAHSVLEKHYPLLADQYRGKRLQRYSYGAFL